MSRKVTIYNTIGDNVREIFSSATTWGGLMSDMNSNRIPYDGMKAVVGETQNTLESSEAVLPDGEFSLFLMAGKVKSGADEDLVDEEDGISWDDIDWDDDSEEVESYTYKSVKDLMLARAKKTSHYLNQLIQYIIDSKQNSSAKPIKQEENKLLKNLRDQAASLQKNLDIFN